MSDLKRLLNAVAELEQLKPIVQQKLEELNRKSTYQVNKGNNHHQNTLLGFSGEFYPANKQNPKACGTTKVCITYMLFIRCHFVQAFLFSCLGFGRDVCIFGFEDSICLSYFLESVSISSVECSRNQEMHWNC